MLTAPHPAAPSPISGRFVTSGSETRRLVSSGVVDAHEGGDGLWYGTSRVGRDLQITEPCSTRIQALFEAKLFGHFEVVKPASTTLVFPAAETAEVWLLDTGKLLVLDDLHPAWRQSIGFMLIMRQRRKLRFFVPVDEVSKLGDLETMFSIARRGFEVQAAIAAMSVAMAKWCEEYAQLRTMVEQAAPAAIPSDLDPAVDALYKHVAKKERIVANALRTIDGLTSVFPKEESAIIGNSPFTVRKVPYPTPEERKKLEEARTKPNEKDNKKKVKA